MTETWRRNVLTFLIRLERFVFIRRHKHMNVVFQETFHEVVFTRKTKPANFQTCNRATISGQREMVRLHSDTVNPDWCEPLRSGYRDAWCCSWTQSSAAAAACRWSSRPHQTAETQQDLSPVDVHSLSAAPEQKNRKQLKIVCFSCFYCQQPESVPLFGLSVALRSHLHLFRWFCICFKHQTTSSYSVLLLPPSQL